MQIGDQYRNERMAGTFTVEWFTDTDVGLAGCNWTWTGRIEDMRQAGFYRPQDGPRVLCNREG